MATPQTTATRIGQFAGDVIDLFIEYRDVHGYSEDRARYQAIQEAIESTEDLVLRDQEPSGVPDLDDQPL